MKRIALITLLGLVACGPTTLALKDPVKAATYASPPNKFHSVTVTLRSYRENSEGKRVEVGGAICSARNSVAGFRNVVTPAQVVVPTFLRADRFKDEGKPPDLTGTCVLEGKKVSFVMEPLSAVGNVTVYGNTTYNPSTGAYTQDRSTHLTGRLSSTLPWRYPNIQVEF